MQCPHATIEQWNSSTNLTLCYVRFLWMIPIFVLSVYVWLWVNNEGGRQKIALSRQNNATNVSPTLTLLPPWLCFCVCVRERERERERVLVRELKCVSKQHFAPLTMLLYPAHTVSSLSECKLRSPTVCLAIHTSQDRFLPKNLIKLHHFRFENLIIHITTI